MVRPLRIFLVILVVLVAIAAISVLVNSRGGTIAGYKLRYPNLLELFDIDTLSVDGSEFSLDPELTRLDFLIDSIEAEFRRRDTIASFSQLDSVPPDDTVVTKQTLPEVEQHISLTAEVLRNRLIAIEYPDSSFDALAPFFASLASHAPSRSLVRVLHYGDSQIEGDRISSFLRRRLQRRFGGQGVGLLHAVPHSYQPSTVQQSVSNNWQKVLISDMDKGAVGYRFGILGGYSTYRSPRRMQARGGFNEAWIRFQRAGSAAQSGRNFSRIRLFYGYNSEPILVSLQYGNQTHDADMYPPSSEIKQLTWDVPLGNNSFQIDIRGDESPLVFGVSLESPTGIIVDNIPIRGSSGADFTRSDDASIKHAMGMLNTKLIILQFGVNIVPHIVDSYKYYENQLYSQITTLKRANPSAAILLVGVSDMSRKEGTRFVSYPNIEKIRDAQRNAAMRAGAAFWDCYQAMGGNNSMPAWVFASPPLAAKDFVHFTFRGSNLIAEMFYASLMSDYERYLSQTNSPQPSKERSVE